MEKTEVLYMRTDKALKNGIASVIYQTISVFLGLISRKVFIDVLGTEYLGLNGLFTNVLLILSLSEMGVSTAIVYHLYKPLAEKKFKEIAQLMNLYKIAYRYISLILFALGLTILPFLKYIIKDSSFSMNYIMMIFVLFLLNTVSSYWFSYKRSLLYVDQVNYITIRVDIIVRILGTILNVILLLTFHSFVIYLVAGMVITLLNNLRISFIVDKRYSFLLHEKSIPEKEKLKKIVQDVKNLFIHRLSSIVLEGTDNILISSFVGIAQVGVYSNYSMIINLIQNFVMQFFNSVQAGFGDMIARGGKSEIDVILKRYTLICFLIGSFCSTSFVCLLDDFITLWLGSKYVMSFLVILIVILNFFIQIIRLPLWQIVNVSGMFKEDRNNALLQAISNLVFSLLLLKLFGLVGVFLGTSISTILALQLKIRLLYNKFLKLSSKTYTLAVAKYFLLFSMNIAITYWLCSYISINNVYINFLGKMFACVTVSNLINVLLFKGTDEFHYVKKLVRTIFVKFKNKSANLMS